MKQVYMHSYIDPSVTYIHVYQCRYSTSVANFDQVSRTRDNGLLI